ncbi:MAG: helix-turn-helix domain-containing protein [bacterium]
MDTKNNMRRIFLKESRTVDLPDLDLTRSRPRAFEEWKVLKSWGRLPVWEQDIPGYLLRTAREDSGFTQGVLGAELGISQQAVAQAERWTSNPSVAFMRDWFKACGLDLKLTVTKKI